MFWDDTNLDELQNEATLEITPMATLESSSTQPYSLQCMDPHYDMALATQPTCGGSHAPPL